MPSSALGAAALIILRSCTSLPRASVGAAAMYASTSFGIFFIILLGRENWLASPRNGRANAVHFLTDGGGEIRTHEAFRPAGFQDRCNQPLCHPSSYSRAFILTSA